MGFMDFLFGKKEKMEDKMEMSKKIKVVAPIDGNIIELDKVPDATFAQGLLGMGIGIEPVASGVIKAPVSGVIEQLFETKHAFVVKTECGVEVLTHFGLNTVKLNGQGFEALAKEGDMVKAGDPIVKYDLDFIKANADAVITPVVILESEEYKMVAPIVSEKAVAGVTEVIEVEK